MRALFGGLGSILLCLALEAGEASYFQFATSCEALSRQGGNNDNSKDTNNIYRNNNCADRADGCLGYFHSSSVRRQRAKTESGKRYEPRCLQDGVHLSGTIERWRYACHWQALLSVHLAYGPDWR